MYDDGLKGSVDKSGNSYALPFVLGTVQETSLIQRENFVSTLVRSTVYTAATSYALNGTVTTLGLLSNAAGALASHSTQIAASYAAGTAMHGTLTQISQALVGLSAQLAVVQASYASQQKTSR
jgi:hypothetical protein